MNMLVLKTKGDVSIHALNAKENLFGNNVGLILLTVSLYEFSREV